MPGQPVDVGEQQAGPLVGGEPPREPDRQDVGIERRLELGEHGGRLAVPGELAAQPAPGEQRELPLLAEMRVPQVAAGDPLEPFPEPAGLEARVEVVEVRPEVLEQLDDR